MASPQNQSAPSPDAQPATSPRDDRSLLGFDRDEIAYILPMALFMAFLFVGSQWPQLYPWAYAGRTFCVAALLFMFRKRYTSIRWNFWWLGILMGIVGIVQWIGMDTLLQQSHRIFGLDLSQPSDNSRFRIFVEHWRHFFALDPDNNAFNPAAYFPNPIARWSWISIRIIGASVVVPFMEELFWRDYLWRRLIAPADFKLASVGEWNPTAFFLVAFAFCVVHPQWLTAIVWGLLVGGLLLYTRSLGACIIMHAVTNFLLGLYVLKTAQWQWW